MFSASSQLSRDGPCMIQHNSDFSFSSGHSALPTILATLSASLSTSLLHAILSADSITGLQVMNDEHNLLLSISRVRDMLEV